MSKLGKYFTSIWIKRDINTVEYKYCLDQWINLHNKKSINSLIAAIAFFVAAIYFTHTEIYVAAVVCFALAINFNSKSNQHIFFTEILNSQYLMSKLINRNYMKDNEYLNELEATEDELNT